MKAIKISRSCFPGNGMMSWIGYFEWVLSKKYAIVRSTKEEKNIDILFYTSFQYNPNDFDIYLKGIGPNPDQFPGKKIFITGEYWDETSYLSILNRSEKNYCLGFLDINHPRYLKFPTYVLDSFILFYESRIFDTPFEWLLHRKSNEELEEIINRQKHLCSVVQASDNPIRDKIFNLLKSKGFVKSSGPWRQTVKDVDRPLRHEFHRPEYIGRTDGLTYRAKIDFFKDCKFNIAVQYTNTEHLTQEKIVHAYAADTIPIFYGNSKITEDFNSHRFVNYHNYENDDNAFNELIDFIDKNDRKDILSEPIFCNNKLPEWYDTERMLEFLDEVINAN